MKKIKCKDFFVLDSYIEEREGKLYKVCLFRDRNGKAQIISALYNPAQYKIEDRNSLNGITTSIEKGFSYSMDKIKENVERPDDASRFVRQLQSYAEKLVKTFAKFNKQLNDDEVESMTTNKLMDLMAQYFSDGLDENGEKTLDLIAQKTTNKVLKNAIIYYLSDEISRE